MALIVEHHVVADQYTVGTTAISAGMLVSLDATGSIIPTDTGADQTIVLGIAGDSALSTEGRTTAYSDQVYLGASANTRWTENRVSDFYDETTAADKMTVYHSGGKFWISDDLFDSSPAINALCGRSGTTAGEWLITATAGQEAGIAVGASQSYQSGVPGTDVNGSTTLGNFVPVLLRI